MNRLNSIAPLIYAVRLPDGVEALYPASLEVADASYYLGRTDVRQVRYDFALAQFRKVVGRYPASITAKRP